MPHRDDVKLAEDIAKWTDDERALLFEVLDEGPAFARKLWRALERPAYIAQLTLGGAARADSAHRDLCTTLEARYCVTCGVAGPDEDHECDDEDDDLDDEEAFDEDDVTDMIGESPDDETDDDDADAPLSGE